MSAISGSFSEFLLCNRMLRCPPPPRVGAPVSVENPGSAPDVPRPTIFSWFLKVEEYFTAAVLTPTVIMFRV